MSATFKTPSVLPAPLQQNAKGAASSIAATPSTAHVEGEQLGGPRASGVGSGEFVIAGNVRRAGSDASRRWRIEQTLSARSVEEARDLLCLGRCEFAALLGVTRSTALAYETAGTIPLSGWMVIELELRARDLLLEFDRRMRRHEIAVRTKRIA
jgi:hypothetical protein